MLNRDLDSFWIKQGNEKTEYPWFWYSIQKLLTWVFPKFDMIIHQGSTCPYGLTYSVSLAISADRWAISMGPLGTRCYVPSLPRQRTVCPEWMLKSGNDNFRFYTIISIPLPWKTCKSFVYLYPSRSHPGFTPEAHLLLWGNSRGPQNVIRVGVIPSHWPKQDHKSIKSMINTKKWYGWMRLVSVTPGHSDQFFFIMNFMEDNTLFRNH